MIQKLDGTARPRRIGNKARYLALLDRGKFRVPCAYVVPWDVHEAFRTGGEDVLERLREDLDRKLDPGKTYAVRSSANVEDAGGHSFAGQFTSVLDASGTQAVLEAVQQVWRSAEDVSTGAYSERNELRGDGIKMAVVVQEMVGPVVSGVAFSKNPVTGMDETIVEAVPGKGTALVQDGVSPWRWVWKWGKWLEESGEPDADSNLARQVVDGVQAIAAKLKRPVDAEWVYDGTALYWVQARPITALPERNVYSNRISREFLPGIIKPLVWSVNVPLVNGAWIALLTELIGRNGLQPEELSKAFYYRAYFNMGAMGRVFASLGMRRETLELMMGLDGGEEKPSFKPSWHALRHVPRMLGCAAGKLFFARRIEQALPEMRSQFEAVASKPLDALDEAALLDEADRLFAQCQKAAYVNIVTPLLMQIYNALFNRRLKKLGIEPADFGLTSGLDGLDDFDPKPALARLHARFSALDESVQAHIREADYEDLKSLDGIEDFQREVEAFLAHFGHFSASGNDFSRVPWREQPELVLRMIAGFEAPSPTADRHTWESLNIGPLTRWRAGPLYRRARQFRYYREAVGFHYTMGYGLFRRLFLALADRLMARGLLDQREDVFYLYWDELRAASDPDSAAETYRALVAQRKQEIEDVADVTLPEIIFGEEAPPLEQEGGSPDRLHGIPASSGYYRGTVCVVNQVEEFDLMTPGAVAVIPYSDVSWTPLLMKAGAIVAESGGTLSHTSIVARECGIPAVVSAGGACKKLGAGMVVAVDGFKGEVRVLGESGTDSPEPASAEKGD